MDTLGWEMLPHEILVDILLYLMPSDRFSVSLVCHAWNECFHLSYVWSNFTFRFVNPNNDKSLQAVSNIGSYMNKVCIKVDQQHPANRTNACKALLELAKLPERKVTWLKVQFVGENPMLYGGQEFLDALLEFFGPVYVDERGHRVNSLTCVDLSGLNVTVDGKIVKAIATHSPQLKNLNIQSKALVCKVAPDDLLHLVNECRKLKKLSVPYCSVTDEVLTALAAKDRQTLEHLSIVVRWQEKFSKEVSSAAWSKLVDSSPNLRVTMTFDSSCPMLIVGGMMKPEIPVSVLRLETFTDLQEEILRACAYYRNTLEKLVVECPKSNVSMDLDRALLRVSADCQHLRSLHVFCVLQQQTVEQILSEHPEMHAEGRYTLKYINEPHPWTAGKDCDD